MQFLFKLFIKDYNNISNPQVRESYGKLAGIVGVLSNTLLCIIKVAAGIVTSSISIIADGINNLTDAASSVITLIGFKLAAMPEDEEHPYGHARFEYLTGLIVSIIIIFVGFSLGKSSIEKIINPSELLFSTTTIIILIIAIIIKIWQALFNFYAGKKINSTALKATAQDSRNDVISTSILLLSVILNKAFNINIDGILGLLVAIFIIYSGICLIKETSSPLLGEAPSEDLVKQIADMVLSYENVLGIHDLVVHNYGPGKVFASLHIEMDADMDVMVSHDIVDNIEREMADKLHIHFVAHMDPIKINDPIIEEVASPIKTVLSQFEGIYNMHDLRCVPGKTHTNIIFDVVRGTECTTSENIILKAVDAKVKEINQAYNVVITFDKSYTNFL